MLLSDKKIFMIEVLSALVY